MNKSILGLIAVGSLIAGPAMAADLRMPVKAPYAPPPAVTNWTGCYIDGGVGYGFADVRHHVDVPGLGALTSDVDSGAEGWLGRVGAGCDYQIGARIVLGVFGDYDFSNINGTWADPLLLSGAGNNSSAWAVGGRIGYLVTPSLLTYVDGGYTQMHSDAVNLNVAIPLAGIGPTGLAIPSHDFNGWFIGGGTEYALSGILPINGLFWRTEYRYSQFQSAELPINCTSAALCGAVGATGVTEHVQQHQQTITTGLVWRFNFGGHVAAQY